MVKHAVLAGISSNPIFSIQEHPIEHPCPDLVKSVSFKSGFPKSLSGIWKFMFGT